MQGPHPDQSVISRLAAGRLQGKPLVDLLQHLAGCPQCSSALGHAAAADPIDPTGAASDERTESRYGRFLDRAAVRVAGLARRLEREREDAAAGVAHLATLPHRERRRTVLTDPRLRTWAVARRALDLSTRSRTEDPEVSEELCALALVVAEALPSRTYGRAILADLRSEVWGAIGNARRIRCDLRGAVIAFTEARGHAEEGTGDPLEIAELSCLHASFLRDAERWDEARREYDLALSLYHDLGDRHMEGRVLISKAILERTVARPDEAMRLLERAPRYLDPIREPRLCFAVRQNRAHILADLGEPEVALRTLDEPGGDVEPRHTGRLDRLRLLWLRGLLLERLGRRAEAREALLRVRRGFERAALPADVALVDLELGHQALEDGDADEARRLATGAFPIFAARQLTRHTLGALDLFRAAGGGV